ncbi:MAG: IS30 family transposase [Fibrobacter sp.]|nr:IS30 family transposase [Fibrobacter sp.]
MSHLNREQRYKILGLLRSRYTQTQIADIIGCSQSTVSREIKRNGSQGKYGAEAAHRKAVARKKASHCHKKYDGYDWRIVDASIRSFMSPQQVRWRCRLMGLKCPCEELIYRHIWEDKRHGGDLYKCLRHKNKKHASRGRKNDYRGRIVGLVSIDKRPAIVDKKERFGDLEVDLVIGKDHKGKLLTINDRATNQSWIRKIGSKNYFAHPYHSWERGANENMNGLIRQFIPKGAKIEDVDERYIRWIENNLNNRPRKRLDYLTPNEYLLKKFNIMR